MTAEQICAVPMMILFVAGVFYGYILGRSRANRTSPEQMQQPVNQKEE